VGEILLVFLNLVNDEEAEREEKQMTEEERVKRRQIVTKKIQSVSRLLRVFNILRTEREMVMKIKGLSPNSRLPPGLLLKGPAALNEGSTISFFGSFIGAAKKWSGSKSNFDCDLKIT
jgi:hypothetical protein